MEYELYDPLPSSHEELDELANTPGITLCWICSQIEPVYEHTYMVCFECGHAYDTPHDLVEIYEREVDWSWEESPDQIPFCPVCLHDF